MTLPLRWLIALAFIISVAIVVIGSLGPSADFRNDLAGSTPRPVVVEPGYIAVDQPVRDGAAEGAADPREYDDRSQVARTFARLNDAGSAPNTAGRAAAGVADDGLPAALRGGAADVHVYYGASGGKNVYVGITNHIARRQAQHGSRFVLEPITTSPVTRGQARAIEEALFMRNPGFQNIRHPISLSHSWYDDALEWGNAWLRNNGL